MRWLEVENDAGAEVLVYGCLACGVGIAVFFVSNWGMAIMAALMFAFVLSILFDLIASSRVPVEARLAAEKAVDAFVRSYPDCKVTSVAIRAIEADRYIYSVRYDGPNGLRSKPTARRYFAVSRATDASVLEIDERDWRPRGLK